MVEKLTSQEWWNVRFATVQLAAFAGYGWVVGSEIARAFFLLGRIIFRAAGGGDQ